jgi:hypothetical protein
MTFHTDAPATKSNHATPFFYFKQRKKRRKLSEAEFTNTKKNNNIALVKLLEESCPNYFLITVKTEEETEKETENLYWIAYFLWKANFWHQYQISSLYCRSICSYFF